MTHSSSGSRDKLVAIDALLKTPLYIEELLSAKVIVLNQIPNDLHFDITPHDKQQILLSNLKSCVVIPLTVKMSIKGLLFFANFENKGILSTEMINKFKLVGRVFSSALLRKQMEEKIANALSEIDQLKNRLQVENVYLRKEVEAKYHHDGIVGQSRAIRNVLALIEQVAKTDSTVLLMGETGTGKELLAISLHRLSKRSIRPMITVNCGGLPQTLIESELFGREKGAFTGAFSNQAGRFEVATESTIFLDEISELPLEVQPKLLRVLQEGQFERLGSPKTHFVDVRVIAATNINLDNAVLAGQFRKDLYYRLNVFPIHVPPLRDRPEDIPPLIWSFVREFEVVMRKNIEQVSKENMDFLQCYSWPGNVRELRNAVERAMILVQGRTLTIDVPNTTGRLTTQKLNLEEVERDHILRVLESSEWRVRGKNGAAEILGLKPTTLDSRLKKLKIKRKSPKYQTTSE